MVPLAVIDVETTGLNPYRHDRIIEVAVVVIKPDGHVIREFTTLINPERDIGPTSKHGLESGDVLQAPRFCDAVSHIAESLAGCVALAGHNVRFDHSFLASEFERSGHTLPELPTICTMQLAGGGDLRRACADYGIACNEGWHSALHDARATA